MVMQVYFSDPIKMAERAKGVRTRLKLDYKSSLGFVFTREGSFPNSCFVVGLQPFCQFVYPYPVSEHSWAELAAL